MRLSKLSALVAVGATLLTLAAIVQAQPRAVSDDVVTKSVSASITCSFLGPGLRGFCSAQPRGTGHTYAFYASGQVSVATGPPGPYRSATCSGLGSVTVVVTDASGNSGSATTSTTCGSGT